MLADFLPHCFFLEKTSNISLEVSHASYTLLIKLCAEIALCALPGSFLSLYLLEIDKSSLSSFSSQSLLSAACPHSTAQGWGFTESFSRCNKLPTWIRYSINIITLAYRKPHTLKTCFPNKAETQSLRQLLACRVIQGWWVELVTGSHPRAPALGKSWIS